MGLMVITLRLLSMHNAVTMGSSYNTHRPSAVCTGHYSYSESIGSTIGYAGLSVGAIGGIVSGLLLAIIICLSSFLWVRKHSQRTPQRHHPDPVPEDDFTNHSTYGEPPPVYTEIDATQYPLVACQHTLSFTVSWEPPPAYDLNPVLHNGPAVPSYTPHLDPPPFEENIDGLCTGHQRSSLLGEIGDGLSQSASTVPIRVGNRSGQQLQSISEQTPSNSSIYTQGRDITILLDPPPDDSSRRETYSDQSSTAIIRPPAIRPGHQTSVAIVGISATGEDLHRSFSTQQPVVYQVPNRYKSSHRGSSMAVIRPPVIRSGHQTSVAIVGRSATGEDLHRSFSTHQPVVYQVPNRYRRSCRGSFHRRPRRRARSRSNPRHSFHHQSANNSHDHLNQLQRTHHVSTDSTDV